MSHFKAAQSGHLSGDTLSLKCVLGKGGVIPADEKREGDGASPLGQWPMRRVFYRPDRVPAPQTGLQIVPLRPFDGWCDAPDHPLYNKPVNLPFPASHECLWRDDHAYDLIIELGYNDAPPKPGHGSAIFLHVAKPGYPTTEGCVALALSDVQTLLKHCTPESTVEITS